ncbi:uncharacterized protein LOC111497051 [Cucurbita maxima]|uniref:Uncharacterized protein LOC111497051 n=1 Tax=Cucurbita maxima TaxID=3661 RepID=A0A6J1KMI6_CUCMA|nr:uncharacterized protein LOC111497051 [Cucurbita maxima]
MVSTLENRFNSRKKLRLVRSLGTHESPGKQRSGFLNAVVFIHKLKLKLEAIEREYLKSIKELHALKEVKVEKMGEEIKVKVRCEKGQNRLVSVLEALERMRVNVVEARVSCSGCFSMEAIAVAEDDQLVNVKDITEAINVAIDA